MTAEVGFRPALKVGNPLSAKADVELAPPEWRGTYISLMHCPSSRRMGNQIDCDRMYYLFETNLRALTGIMTRQ
jgi:hypothetical protein